MSLSLNDREWQEFFIGGSEGVFEISSSSSGIDKNKLEECGVGEAEFTPYITRTDVNNGINQFIPEKQRPKYSLDEGGVITIGLDTQTVFFQPYKFYTGQNIQVLSHKNLNQLTSGFLIPLLKVQMEKFNWGGNGATLGRLFRTKIMLPITNDNKLDWQFMEQYSKAIIEKKKAEYERYAKKALDSLEYKEIEALEDKEWGEFFLEDIADILPGRDIYEAERFPGNTPYVSSTAKNNGIGYFVGNTNLTLEENCLSVNRNGSVGYSFFHPYKGLFSNDCRKLKLKNSCKHVGLFIANQITKQRKKYNYGYKMGTARLKRQKIKLPVIDNRQPDFKYIKQYMINIEYTKRKQYLKSLNSSAV